MSRIVINGDRRLYGSVAVHGSKNAVLPVMAASLMNQGITVIRNCPDIADVRAMQKILEFLECKVQFKNDCMIIDTVNAQSKELKEELTKPFRGSSILIGPMLVRFGSVKIAQPGGCNIGSRPLDIHLNSLKRLGASWRMTQDYIEVEGVHLTVNDVMLRFPSVGATENTVMAAAMLNGTTTISNAAKEPEIVTLCEYLEKAGAVITGAGTDCITVTGRGRLHSAEIIADADRIVAGTYMAAVTACGGSVFLENCKIGDCQSFLDVITGMGARVTVKDNAIFVEMNQRPENLNYIHTGPYPEFSTDMQSIILSVAAKADGVLKLKEQIFENRFKTAPWLEKMGADIKIEKDLAVVKGREYLNGCEVTGEDLRGTAALVVAGLCAQGTTIIHNADYIKRGYMDLCENFRRLGADIKWEDN